MFLNLFFQVQLTVYYFFWFVQFNFTLAKSITSCCYFLGFFTYSCWLLHHCYILHIPTCININIFTFGNYRWKTFKIKILYLLALPKHQPMPQLQTLTQHQLLQDPSWIIKVNNFKSLHQGEEMLMIKKKL